MSVDALSFVELLGIAISNLTVPLEAAPTADSALRSDLFDVSERCEFFIVLKIFLNHFKQCILMR